MGPRDTELRGGSSSCRHLRELDPLGTQSCPASQKQRHRQCTHDGCYLMSSTGRHREVAAYTVIVPDRPACGAAQGHPGLTSLVPGWGLRTQRCGPPRLPFMLSLSRFLSTSPTLFTVPACAGSWVERVPTLSSFSVSSPCPHPILAKSCQRGGPRSSTWRRHAGSGATEQLSGGGHRDQD